MSPDPLRPRKTRPPSPKTGEGIEGRLVHRENLGSDLFLHVQVVGVSTPLIARADPAEGEAFSIGDTVVLTVDPRHTLLFDAAGQRIRP